MLTNREIFIKNIFLPVNRNLEKEYMSEEEAISLVKRISDIGNNIGFIGNEVSQDKDKNTKRSHKYDVWIAKEIKKDKSIIDRETDIRMIIDWILSNKIDIFKYSFLDAFEEQKKWHAEMLNKYETIKIEIPGLDDNRIIFRCSNQNYFIYLLNEKDLGYEGNIMGHCVGGDFYKQKIKNKQSIVLSLRDTKNIPHVTIEIDAKNFVVIQQYSKGNSKPPKKYMSLIHEFVLFAGNYDKLKEKEMMKFLNINF